MSVLVNVGGERHSAAGPAPGAEAGDRGARKARMIGIACAGALLLAAVPMPAIREAGALEERCVTLTGQLDRLRAEAAAVESWRSGDRRRAAQVDREFRRWFATERRLLETRNHVLRVARSLGLEITDVQVSNEDSETGGVGRDAIAADLELESEPGSDGGMAASELGSEAGREWALAVETERVQVAGRGGLAEVLLLGAMLDRLEPSLRVLALEFTGTGARRDFSVLAERFYEAPAARDADKVAQADEPGAPR